MGSFIINGQTLGSAVARSTAEALLDALVIAESCQNCTAGLAVFSNLFEEIIVNGVSVAEVELAGQSQFGTTVSQSADFFIETVNQRCQFHCHGRGWGTYLHPRRHACR